MDIILDIARASLNLGEVRAQQSVDVALMRKTIEFVEVQAENLIDVMPNTLSLSGNIIDVKV